MSSLSGATSLVTPRRLWLRSDGFLSMQKANGAPPGPAPGITAKPVSKVELLIIGKGKIRPGIFGKNIPSHCKCDEPGHQWWQSQLLQFT